MHMDEDDGDTPYKETYWITPLNTSSVRSQYQSRFTLINKPEREDEIKKWLLDTFGYGKYIYKVVDNGYYYAEIFSGKNTMRPYLFFNGVNPSLDPSFRLCYNVSI